MGWPFWRRRRIVSLFEMLKWDSEGGGAGEFVPLFGGSGMGEFVFDLEGIYPPFPGQLRA